MMCSVFFNGMCGAQTTKLKVKQVLNMIMDTTLGEGLIVQNPSRSKRLKITGAASKYTDAYSV